MIWRQKTLRWVISWVNQCHRLEEIDKKFSCENWSFCKLTKLIWLDVEFLSNIESADSEYFVNLGNWLLTPFVTSEQIMQRILGGKIGSHSSLSSVVDLINYLPFFPSKLMMKNFTSKPSKTATKVTAN